MTYNCIHEHLAEPDLHGDELHFKQLVRFNLFYLFVCFDFPFCTLCVFEAAVKSEKH